ncbi:MAG: hypothetical protein RIR69_1118, partial [Actinomycetota bacterium]
MKTKKPRLFVVCLTASLLTLSSCGTNGEPDSSNDIDVETITQQVETAIDEFLTTTGAPGATVALLLPEGDGDTNELRIARGLSNVAKNQTATPDDHFRFGSITKTMTSGVVLQLVDEGLIALDEPVATYLGSGWAKGYVLNGVDYGDLVTIRQILNHTDGFAEFAFDPQFYLLASTRLDTEFTPKEIVQWATERGPQYVPGTEYSYNTVGHVVAGLVIEKVTGQPAEEVLRTRIFDSVDANDAYLAPTRLAPDDSVSGYVQGILKNAIDLIPGFQPYRASATVGDFYDITAVPQPAIRSAGWTGGGIESQADDIARIFRSLFTSVVTGDELEEFVTPSEFSNYGLGVTVGEKAGQQVYSHGGGVPGFRSEAVFVPDLDITIAVSANLISIDPDISTLTDSILQ